MQSLYVRPGLIYILMSDSISAKRDLEGLKIMFLMSFLKASLAFVVGAGMCGGFTWLMILLYFKWHPQPAQQLGDMFNVFAYALGAIALTGVMGLLGGIAGILVIRRLL